MPLALCATRHDGRSYEQGPRSRSAGARDAHWVVPSGKAVAARVPSVDLAAVRDRGVADLPLEDGDVVIVDSNRVKKGAVTMWNQTLRVLSLRVLYR